jgi:membrane-bound serine protease (ClpP class)
MVDDGLAVLVERAVKESQGAKALVFIVDTPGGLVDSAIDITSHIGKARCPTVAYIEGMGAISAGAMISYACDTMIMTGDTNIGAATPVTFSEEGATVAGEKSVSFVRSKFRSLATINGHNADIAEAMVDSDVVLRECIDAEGKLTIVRGAAEDDSNNEDATEDPGCRVVLEKDKLLTLTAQDALAWGLIPHLALDFDDALSFLGIDDYARRELMPTWSEELFRFLTNPTIAGILIFLGIGGIYLEAQTPGFGFAGVVGLVCLSLFFGAHILIGLADWLDVLLVLVGIGLLMVEVFLLPGFGVAGVAGIIALGMGLYMSLTRVTFPEYSWQFDQLDNVAISLAVAVVGMIALVLLGGWIFPKTPFYGKLVLQTTQNVDQGYVMKTEEEFVVGMRGVALSMLRPAGRGRFNDQSIQVVARGDFIEAGTPIVIVQTDGNRYMVDAVKERA